MVMDFYRKSDLPEKTYYQCIIVLLFRNYLKVANQIIDDKINKSNIEQCINEVERFISNKHDGQEHSFNYDELWDSAKTIYDKLQLIKNS